MINFEEGTYFTLIKGFEDYLISNKGHIWSYKTLRQIRGFEENGFTKIKLTSRKGKLKVFSAHKLVAEYFISNPLGFKNIMHVDGNKDNNRMENLAWCNVIPKLNNKKQRPTSPTGYRGIYRLERINSKDNQKVVDYKVIVTYRKAAHLKAIQKYIGVFSTLTKAIAAYNEEALRVGIEPNIILSASRK